ncbi:MAG: hypothetical protein PHT12_03465 [Patescibacteria group bacterium]|nr:hypothetical protein [Patescibacteria group bacterium]
MASAETNVAPQAADSSVTFTFSPEGAKRLWGIKPETRVLRIDPPNMRRTFDYFVGYGFTAGQLKVMGRKRATIFAVLTEDEARSAIARFESLGFDPPAIRHILATNPGAVLIPRNRIEALIRSLTDIELTRQQALFIITKAPLLIGREQEKIDAHIELFVDRLLTMEDVHAVLVDFGGILSNSTARNHEMLDILFAMGFDVTKRCRRFEFAPELIRGRIAFLQKKGDDADEYAVFLDNDEFEETHGITRAELVALDPGSDWYREEAARCREQLRLAIAKANRGEGDRI